MEWIWKCYWGPTQDSVCLGELRNKYRDGLKEKVLIGKTTLKL